VINSSELLTNLVTLLRDIQDLVFEMDGDPERISAYLDAFPRRSSLVHAIHQMPVPSIMAVWQGTAPGTFGGVDVWKHQVTLYLRARETKAGDESTAYFRMFRQIVRGRPASVGVHMLDVAVHPSCHPMDLPSIQRQTDAEGLDYFEVQLSFTEIGDE
jgi:hypothetical protein